MGQGLFAQRPILPCLPQGAQTCREPGWYRSRYGCFIWLTFQMKAGHPIFTARLFVPSISKQPKKTEQEERKTTLYLYPTSLMKWKQRPFGRYELGSFTPAEYESILLKLYLFLFIYSAELGLSCGMCDLHCGMRDLWLQHVGSSFLTRDWTQAPWTESTES